MSLFSVINNGHLATPAVPASPRPIEAGDARALVIDRPWHVTGENSADAAATVRAGSSGIFVTGSQAHGHAAELRSQHPSTPIITEPLALTHYVADEDAPFGYWSDGGFDTSLSLEAMLDRRRAAGDPIAMTPTGQIRAGDSEALKAVIDAANDLDRDDILVAVPLEANWLSKDPLTDQIVRVLDRSNHPIALTFIDGNSPLGSMKRMRAHRRVLATTTADILAYRIDLNGLDAIALGAIGAAIGAYPTKRRLDPANKGGGGPSDREALSPQMLIPDMLRFVRSTEMRRSWFVNADPVLCYCAVCGGAPLHRLFESNAERAIGHRHNVVGIDQLINMLLVVPRVQRSAVWANLITGAADTYPQLSLHLNRPMSPPNDLGVWAEPAI